MLLLMVCIAGFFLGLYFRVLVLLPATLIGSAIFVFANSSSGLGFYSSLGDLLLLLISGQASYMLGLTGRDAYGHILARFHAVQSNRI
jgi:hypothetical protein